MNMHLRLSSMKKMVLNCRKEPFVCIVNRTRIFRIIVQMFIMQDEAVLYDESINFLDSLNKYIKTLSS